MSKWTTDMLLLMVLLSLYVIGSGIHGTIDIFLLKLLAVAGTVTTGYAIWDEHS